MEEIFKVEESQRGHNTSDSAGFKQRVSGALRMLAAFVMLGSALTFLVQGWSGWGSEDRILAFLALTGVIAGAGLLSGLVLKDDKGARVALGVATAVIPVMYAQTGGLLLSLIGQTAGPTTPDIFLFRASSKFEVFFTASVVVAVTSGIAWLGYSALARNSRCGLFYLYLIGNCLMLVPTRASGPVAVVILFLSLMTCWWISRMGREKSEVGTFEERVASLTLLVPAGIIVGRSLTLYSPSNLLVFANWASLALAALVSIPYLLRSTGLRKLFQGFAAFPIMMAGIYLTSTILVGGDSLLQISDAHRLVLNGIMVGAAYWIASSFTFGDGCTYRFWATLFPLLTALLQLGGDSGLVNSFLLVMISILVIVVGSNSKDRLLLGLGGLGVAAGLISHIEAALRVLSGLGPWLSLGILGVAILLISSLIERDHVLVRKLMMFRREVLSWKR